MENDKKFKISCPKCRAEIDIDEALTSQIAGDILAKSKKEEEERWAEREEKIKREYWAKAQNAASSKSEKEVALLKEELELQKKKRIEAEEEELKLRKQKLELEEAKKSFEIEKQRQMDAERARIKEETAKTITDEHRLKDAEKEKKINDLSKALEDAQRKIQQGSQQTQGEVLELELEATLMQEFPMDEISPVPKGINGADVIQTVFNKRGRRCGSIAWEMKRTKNWTEGWVQKLKDDQRRVKAEIAVLISEILPSGIAEAGYYQGIYVATPKMALNLGKILRNQIVEVSDVLSLEEGKADKKDMIWNYLMGPEFRGRINSFLEAVVAMKKSLDQEKRAYTKIWAEREKLIGRIEMSMAGLSGEIKGIAGKDLISGGHLELESGEEILDDIIEEENPEPRPQNQNIEQENPEPRPQNQKDRQHSDVIPTPSVSLRAGSVEGSLDSEITLARDDNIETSEAEESEAEKPVQSLF